MKERSANPSPRGRCQDANGQRCGRNTDGNGLRPRCFEVFTLNIDSVIRPRRLQSHAFQNATQSRLFSPARISSFFFLFASTCWCAGKPVTSYVGRHKFKKTWKAPARGAAWQRVLPSVRIFILWSKATLASLLLTWVEGKLAGLFAVSEID